MEEAKRKNKTNQEVKRIEKELTILETNLGKSADWWNSSEIWAFLLILEISTKTGRKIVIKSLERKFGLVKTLFATRGHPMSMEAERDVRMALNVHTKIRLDTADHPTKDGAAPILSPIQWIQILEWLNTKAKANTKPFMNKKYMAMLSISFGFSTGLRLSEIHRLKYSDLSLDGDEEIKIRIRRSKSNRTGHKKVWNVAPGYAAEPLLCPIRNLWEYVEKNNKTMHPGAYIFSNDPEGKDLTRIENLVGYWRKGAKGAGLAKCHWPQAHSFHNSKINMARALGYSEDKITDAMNWCSVSVLHQYLRKMQEDKGGIAYRLTSMSAVELTEQTKHLWN